METPRLLICVHYCSVHPMRDVLVQFHHAVDFNLIQCGETADYHEVIMVAAEMLRSPFSCNQIYFKNSMKMMRTMM